MNRLRLLLSTLIALALVACGSGEGSYGSVELQIRSGFHDQAEVALRGDASPRAEGLRRLIVERREALSKFDRELEEIWRLEPKRAVVVLKEKLRRETDPALEERIERALSDAVDRRAAHAAGRGHQTASLFRKAPKEGHREEGYRDIASLLASEAEREAQGAGVAVAVRQEDRPAPAPRSGEAPTESGATDSLEKVALPEGEEPGLRAEIDRWLEVAFDSPPGDERQRAVARSRVFERRLTMRKEIAAALERDLQPFAALGVAALDDGYVQLDESWVSWSALPRDVLQGVVRLTELSRDGRVGWMAERLERGESEGRSGALADAHRMVEGGQLDVDDAWAMVAQSRDEEVPVGGYRFASAIQRWVPAAQAQLSETLAALAKLEKSFARAKSQGREARVDEILALGELGEVTLERALAARLAADVRRLTRSKVLAQLSMIARQRLDLDQRRKDALELIFDEEEYFYPYKQPDVSADKARLYLLVQQRVDELVARVRDVWDAPRSAKLSGSFSEALEDFHWTRGVASANGFELELPVEIPTWLPALDPETRELSLHEFAWEQDEADLVVYNRALRARNEGLWAKDGELSEEQRAKDAERRQVRITNDYRLLFGRRALAWNPAIEAGARMHSEYMARTGDFGHFEPDPERRAPGDRMRLAGYTHGVGENCAMSGGDPGAAHNGWVHSSGHHRNLLNSGHREMASAIAGRYWTQNFGVDRSFVGELEEWHD